MGFPSLAQFLTLMLMERRRFISDCVTKAAEDLELGYPSTKQEQLDVAIELFHGHMTRGL